VDALLFGVDEENAVDVECHAVLEQLPARASRTNLRRIGTGLHFRDIAQTVARHEVVGPQRDL
jgi:hypothetical protein